MVKKTCRNIIAEIYNEAKIVLHNIKSRAIYTIGMAYILAYPNVVDQSKLHKDFDLKNRDGKVDVKFQDVKHILGIGLPDNQREEGVGDLVRLARGILVASPVEYGVDYLGRAARIIVDGVDPMVTKERFGIDLKHAWAKSQGLAGSLILEEDRRFLELLAIPLRNLLHHNRGELYPGKKIQYTGNPRQHNFEVDHTYYPGEDNELRWLTTMTAFQINETVCSIVLEGLERALQGMRS